MELSKAGGLLKTGEGGETRESESIRKENRFKELREALFSGLIAGDAAPREIRSLTAESIAFRTQSRQDEIRTQLKEAKGAYEYTLSVRDVQLSETDAFVEYNVAGNVVLAGVIKGHHATVQPLPMDYASLRVLIEKFHRACTDPACPLDRKEATSLAAALTPGGLASSAPLKTLYVAPDKALGLVPFSLLFETAGKHGPVADRIILMPSLSVMRQMKRRKGKNAQRTIALMGDPLPLNLDEAVTYKTPGKPRLSADARAISVQPGPVKAPVGSVPHAPVSPAAFSYGVLERIPYTEKEIQTIAATGKWQTQILSGQQFTKEKVMEVLSKDFMYVHFATHAVISYEIPYIMAPSLFVSAFDRPIDHFWDAGAIARLNLESARLVVLSACKTGIDAGDDHNGIDGQVCLRLCCCCYGTCLALLPTPPL